MEEENEFLDWIVKKARIHTIGVSMNFSQGEIWWAALEKNVGVEINGKGKCYSRPVLVFKKLSKTCFFAIPLTSQTHKGSWYVEFESGGKVQYAVLSQIRMMSAVRLYNRMGRISASDFEKVRTGFQKLIG